MDRRKPITDQAKCTRVNLNNTRQTKPSFRLKMTIEQSKLEDSCYLASGIHYFDRGDNQKLKVIFIHGAMFSARSWLKVVHSLEKECHCLVPELRGHGKSKRAASYQLEDFQGDLEETLFMDSRKSLIVGHSLGAVVGLGLALKYPERVKGLFLEEPPLFFGESQVWRDSTFADYFNRMLKLKEATLEHPSPRDFAFQQIKRTLEHTFGLNIPYAETTLMARVEDLIDMDIECLRSLACQPASASLPKEFPCDTTILVGEEKYGGAIPSERLMELRSIGRLAKFVEFRGCGHGPHYTVGYEDRFERELRSFLTTFDASVQILNNNN